MKLSALKITAKGLHTLSCSFDWSSKQLMCGLSIHSGTYFPSAKHSSLTVELLATGTTSGNCTSIFGSYSPITPAVTKRNVEMMPCMSQGNFFSSRLEQVRKKQNKYRG